MCACPVHTYDLRGNALHTSSNDYLRACENIVNNLRDRRMYCGIHPWSMRGYRGNDEQHDLNERLYETNWYVLYLIWLNQLYTKNSIFNFRFIEF